MAMAMVRGHGEAVFDDVISSTRRRSWRRDDDEQALMAERVSARFTFFRHSALKWACRLEDRRDARREMMRTAARRRQVGDGQPDTPMASQNVRSVAQGGDLLMDAGPAQEHADGYNGLICTYGEGAKPHDVARSGVTSGVLDDHRSMTTHW